MTDIFLRNLAISRQCQEQCSVADKVKGQLETTSFELDGVLMEVESNRTDKLILKQQVCVCGGGGGGEYTL